MAWVITKGLWTVSSGQGDRTAIRRFQHDIKAAATGNLTADEANRLVMAR